MVVYKVLDVREVIKELFLTVKGLVVPNEDKPRIASSISNPAKLAIQKIHGNALHSERMSACHHVARYAED